MVPAPAIEARGLRKVFEKQPSRWQRVLRRGTPGVVKAVDGVDLTIPAGELFGLLGPNGAGKTTLVKLLCTLLLPTEGSIRVGGVDVTEDPDDVRRRVGVVLGGERALYWRLTGWENLWFFSQLYNLPGPVARDRIDELLGLVGLSDRAGDRVEDYSKGMKQRLHLARGLLNDPDILLLDEPTIGLDPHAARDVRALVRSLVREQGKTVVLTTHYMYEADELSDRVAIMHRGSIVALGSPEALKARLADRTVLRLEVARQETPLLERLRELPRVASVVEVPGDGPTAAFRLQGHDSVEGLPGAVASLVEKAGADLRNLQVERPSLEDVFLELTGHTIDPGGRAHGT